MDANLESARVLIAGGRVTMIYVVRGLVDGGDWLLTTEFEAEQRPSRFGIGVQSGGEVSWAFDGKTGKQYGTPYPQVLTGATRKAVFPTTAMPEVPGRWMATLEIVGQTVGSVSGDVDSEVRECATCGGSGGRLRPGPLKLVACDACWAKAQDEPEPGELKLLTGDVLAEAWSPPQETGRGTCGRCQAEVEWLFTVEGVVAA